MERLRVSLIGPGDIDFHYQNILKISKEKFQLDLEKIAEVLSESGVDIELLPDKGVCLELAKLYKANEGKKVIGSAPISDKRYGVKHLEQYMNEKIGGKKLFDEFIDTKDWRDQYRMKGLMGDIVLYLGISPGTETELNYAIYLFKLMKGFKENVTLKGINSEMRAGKNIQYAIFVYKPFISNKFSKETEAYIKKFGIKLEYIQNPKELKQKLLELPG